MEGVGYFLAVVGWVLFIHDRVKLIGVRKDREDWRQRWRHQEGIANDWMEKWEEERDENIKLKSELGRLKEVVKECEHEWGMWGEGVDVIQGDKVSRVQYRECKKCGMEDVNTERII